MKPPDCSSIWPASLTSSQRDFSAAASTPSTRSALRPVATPVALVVNGFLASPPPPTVIRPALAPLWALNSKAKPVERLLARMQGLVGGVAAEPPVVERQP